MPIRLIRLNRCFWLPPWQRITAVWRADHGVSAIEFALLAPVLIIALLGTVDVGRALTEQMTISSALRSGAQTAIAGGDVVAVERILRAAASKNFTLAARGAKGDAATLSIDVRPMYACPDNPQTEVGYSTTCAGPTSTAIYYTLTAEKTFAGIFLPDIPLGRTLQVQVR